MTVFAAPAPDPHRRRGARRWRPWASRARRWQRLMLRRVRHYLPDVAAFVGALLFAGMAALLTGSLGGCGGGVGSEGTGSFASGTITGYGSIIVNGVRFDESAAQVTDDDGQAVARSALALGMVVQISGGTITTAADGSSAAVANSVRVQRALVGPVDMLDLRTGRLSVLGQAVQVAADTVFDERLSGGLAALMLGQWLEIYGAYNPGSAAFVATRVGAGGPSAGQWVSGAVASVDPAAKTFKLGNQTYSYGAAASAPMAGTQGAFRVQALPDAQGRWVITSQASQDSPPQERDGARLDGLISQVLASNRFVLDGVVVDASAARLTGTLQVGSKAEVAGTLRAGVLVASRVEVTTESLRTYELNGTLSNLDTVRKRFVVRGTTVSYARSDVVFDKGTAAQLSGYTGQLKVEGVLSADRTWVEAQRIRFSGN